MQMNARIIMRTNECMRKMSLSIKMSARCKCANGCVKCKGGNEYVKVHVYKCERVSSDSVKSENV